MNRRTAVLDAIEAREHRAAVGHEPLQTPLRTVNPRVLHYSEERKRADLDDDPGYEPERVDSVTGYPVQPMPWGIR